MALSMFNIFCFAFCDRRKGRRRENVSGKKRRRKKKRTTLALSRFPGYSAPHALILVMQWD
jgi:hypothetical protein